MAHFSSLASKFLNQSLVPNAGATTSQPLFSSVAEGSEATQDDDQFDDEDDPHLRRATASGNTAYDYDPFNLEDIPDDERDGSDALPFGEYDEEDAGASQSLPLLLQSRSWKQHRPQSPSSSLPSTASPPPHAASTQGTRSQPARTTITDSLLPRDSVFFLPHPHRAPRRKFNDQHWATLWYTSVGACLLGSILILFLTSKPAKPLGPLLYSTLTHTIPLITLFTILSAIFSYVHIALLRLSVKPILLGTAVAVPAILVIAAVWAFAGSFFWTSKDAGWSETVGLRIFALVPLVLAGLSARSIYNRRFLLHQTISVVTLTAQLLLEASHLPLLVASPSLLLVVILGSLPFYSLVLHLLLIGTFGGTKATGWEWHVYSYAWWLVLLVILIWFWSWCVARNVLRVTVAGITGAWYFKKPSGDAMETAHAAAYRAIGPSLGTSCLSALVLTGINLATLLMHACSRIVLPPALQPLIGPLSVPAAFVTKSMISISSYALVYSGLSGQAFFPAARCARGLTSSRAIRTQPSYTLLSILLVLTAFAMGVISAVVTYVFTAYTLENPAAAPFASFIGGSVTFLVGWFCMSLVDDVADSLYVCYCLDLDANTMHQTDVFDAFEGRSASAQVPSQV